MSVRPLGLTIPNIVSNSTTAYVSEPVDGLFVTGGVLTYTATVGGVTATPGDLTLYIDGSEDGSTWTADTTGTAIAYGASPSSGSLVAHGRWRWMRVRGVAASASAVSYWVVSPAILAVQEEGPWGDPPDIRQIVFAGGTIAAADDIYLVPETAAKGHVFGQRVRLTRVAAYGYWDGGSGDPIVIELAVNAAAVAILTLSHPSAVDLEEREYAEVDVRLAPTDSIGVRVVNADFVYTLSCCHVVVTYEVVV